MEKKADSGVLSILAAVASPIAAAVVKALFDRRSRSQSKKGADEMCRNHSHVTGRIFGLEDKEGYITVKILVTQPVTLETSYGAKLTLPRYATCILRLAQPDASLGSQLQQMAEQVEPALFREELSDISGPMTPPK